MFGIKIAKPDIKNTKIFLKRKLSNKLGKFEIFRAIEWKLEN
jgi:hypothetical protein